MKTIVISDQLHTDLKIEATRLRIKLQEYIKRILEERTHESN